MTTIVTADLHFSANPRDSYRWKFLEETLPELAKEHDARRLLILGDITEAKDGHPATLVNRIVDGLSALAESIDVIILRGNHDGIREDTPFFRFTSHMPRVRWINEPTTLKLRGLGNCLFLPHSRRPADDWSDLLPPVEDWVFCHQTFGGADLGHGHKAEGDSPPIEMFGKKARVISGDVHVPQKVAPVTYAGSPYSIDFSDDADWRVLLLDGHEMHSVSITGPQKRLVELDLLSSAPPRTEVRPGDVVKVRIDLSANAPNGLEISRAKARSMAQDWAAEAGVELYAVQIVAPPTERGKKAASKHDHRSDEELIRAYAKKTGQGKASIAAGLKYLEEDA